MATMHYRVQLLDNDGKVAGEGYANLDADAVKGKFHSKTQARDGFAGSGGKKYSGKGRGNSLYFTVGKAAVGRPDKPQALAVWPSS